MPRVVAPHITDTKGVCGPAKEPGGDSGGRSASTTGGASVIKTALKYLSQPRDDHVALAGGTWKCDFTYPSSYSIHTPVPSAEPQSAPGSIAYLRQVSMTRSK
jgi:hypothetical protein